MGRDCGQRTSIRWDDMYPLLTAAAEAEGISRAEYVRETVRARLKGAQLEVPQSHEPTSIDNKKNKVFARIGKLIEPLEAKAMKENRSVSVIIRKALRFYMGQTRIPEVREFYSEIKRLTGVMSRIGGNLNQVALAFNADEILKGSDLAQVHTEMKQAFREFSGTLIAIRSELERQNP